MLSIEDCNESLYDDNGDDTNSNISYETICDISLTERLIRCHPIWFLPDIQRAGAIHLLQGKEEGVIFYKFLQNMPFTYQRISVTKFTFSIVKKIKNDKERQMKKTGRSNLKIICSK